MERMSDKATMILAGCATVLIAMALWAGPALAESRAEVRRIITEEARDSTVPASLALAVAKVESDFRDDYESPTGARGVMQIMPRTAVEEFGVRARDLWRARPNVRLGIRILEDLIEAADGRWDDALAGYATGRVGKIRRATRAGSVIRDYVGAVLGWERRFAEEMIAGDEVERRKREVLLSGTEDALRVGADGRYLDRAHDQDRSRYRRDADYCRPPRRRPLRLARYDAAEDDFVNDIEARRRLARRTLDDFADGSIPIRHRRPR
jgi:hypothetical protein